jgi:Xaa-Pro aminopeptidase
MFQTYEAAQSGGESGERIERLRELMAQAGVDALLVPHGDEYNNEYLPACAERLAFVTGFTGSAGTAVIAKDGAALFVDGRYILQAPRQVDTAIFEVLQLGKAKVGEWLAKTLKADAIVGYDPKLHAPGGIEELTQELAAKRIKLEPLSRNPVDQLWGKQRPAQPRGGVVVHLPEHAGKPAKDKLADLRATLKKDGQDAVVLTFPPSICWLFNIRGSDVAHNPIVLAFAIVPLKGKAELFIDAAKVGGDARKHLAPLAEITKLSELGSRLTALKRDGKTVRLSPAAPIWFHAKLKGRKGRVISASDPCVLPQARKNDTEIAGARAAHKRDGAAMARFLAWLDREAPSGRIDEIAAAKRLEELRADTQQLREISFDTISGAGPNGAIVHYRVTTATNRVIKPGELYLVDSGAQYLDGTTDVTRTVAVGTLPKEMAPEMRERFTRVLKGHIAVATARFPTGTRGVDLDPFARRALWEAGLDFDHGTGHGVGSYLCVHEGPQSIGKQGMVPLEPGMIVSNEPGYYKTGAYGIRIENLLLVTGPEKVPGGERELMAFDTLTLVPIDRRLVVPELLSAAELAWLNAYHARVRKAIGPELGPDDRAWLEQATQPL